MKKGIADHLDDIFLYGLLALTTVLAVIAVLL